MRIGIVGYGHLGQYLARHVMGDEGQRRGYEIVFVWNRTPEAITQDSELMAYLAARDCAPLGRLEDLAAWKGKVDLIVEMCHPVVVQQHISMMLDVAHVFVGSLTAFADEATTAAMRAKMASQQHCLFVPSGAFWGASDIKKMAELGTLERLVVTMKKHPSSLKLSDPLKQTNQACLDAATGEECVLYSGSVRGLCPLAPNNVNTMACAALCASNLGFDKTEAKLIADTSLDCHIVEVLAVGPGGFEVNTVRRNPAAVGAVTGNATYNSFVSSLNVAGETFKGAKGIVFC
eukprot:PhM_4_TR6139/c0_g1_i1/m.55789/K06989/nadX; aspartate dehydrogenase